MSSTLRLKCYQLGRPSLIQSIHLVSRYRQTSANIIPSLRSLTQTSHCNNIPIKTVLDCQLRSFKYHQNIKHVLLCQQLQLNRNMSRNTSITESKRNQTTSTKGAKTPDAAKSAPAEQPLQTGPVITAITEDIVEAVVGKKSEISEGEMREVELGEEYKALLIYQNGKFTAVANKCTHYGAPLAKGYLGDGRVRCPWHGACFNVSTGDIEDFPGLDNLSCYDVRIEGDDIIVRANKKSLQTGRRPITSISPPASSNDAKVFVIVGGGPASVVCAETLRQEGFEGKIILCSREESLPYDRPKLSKAMHLSAADIALRPDTFYDNLKIELQLGKNVTGVDPTTKSIKFSDESTLKFDCLLLATGAKPRTLPVPGFDDVYLLREPSQANAIATVAKDKRVVVIGTSFIGMEVASYLSDKASSVECIDIAAVPFERVLGERIGKSLQQLLEEKGIKFHLKAGVKEIVSEEGKITGVTLPSGETLPADIVIAGVGVVPATDFLKDSGLPITRRGEVIVDEHMKVTDGIYAAGDIAYFPLPMIESSISIGHWQIAHNHGRVAGRNMAGKEEMFNSIPYFWTVLCGKSLRYCGFALEWDDIIFNGNPEEQKFAAFFVKGEKVLAVASLAMDPVVSTSAELMYQGKMPTATQLRSNPDLKSHL